MKYRQYLQEELANFIADNKCYNKLLWIEYQVRYRISLASPSLIKFLAFNGVIVCENMSAELGSPLQTC